MLTATPQKSTVPWSAILALLGYLTLQLACAVLAALAGLDRRAYDAIPLTALLPAAGESEVIHLRRQVLRYHSVLVQNQDQNNAKVTQMAIAYRAGRNFIIGLVVFGVVAAWARLTPIA